MVDFLTGAAKKQELVRLTEADLPAVMELEQLSSAWPWTEAGFQGEFRRKITVGLGLKGETLLTAHCFFWLLEPEIHLLNLAVRPEYRRQGQARRLLTAMLARGREAGVETVFLEVRASNRAALALYESLGFAAVCQRSGYYDDGEDALLMTLITSEV